MELQGFGRDARRERIPWVGKLREFENHVKKIPLADTVGG
jgi:hypothetical protein